MSESEELYIKPEAIMHMLEDIDQLAESGNADGILCRSLIKAGFVDIFDAYSLLFDKGLVSLDRWEEYE